MKIILDLAKLQETGTITAEQAKQLTQWAVKETGGIAINALLAFGSIAVALGFLSLAPSAVACMIIGAVLIGGGFYIRRYQQEQWGLLGSINVLVGTLALTGGFLWLCELSLLSLLIVMLVVLGMGIAIRNGLLMALSAYLTAVVLGSSTGYTKAAYMLLVTEATVTAVVFSALAWGVFQLSRKFTTYERLCIIYARMCLVLANLGFWVGSLWGDYPLQTWLRGTGYYDWRFDGTSSTTDHTFFIPAAVFGVLWAAALIGAALWGVKHNRRYVVNTCVVFGSIHFYTQWFETLGGNPLSVMLGGMLTIAIGIGLWRYNKQNLA